MTDRPNPDDTRMQEIRESGRRRPRRNYSDQQRVTIGQQHQLDQLRKVEKVLADNFPDLFIADLSGPARRRAALEAIGDIMQGYA
jgi:hypothetical protein